MGVIIKGNKCEIITVPKTIHFDLPKNFHNNLRHEIDFIKKHNEFSAEHMMKNRIS